MSERDCTIINWNVYLGANIARLVDGEYPRPIEERAEALWKMVRQTDFPRRAGFIAERIAELQPDFVTLQEVFRWSVQGAHGSDATSVDYLDILERELVRRGASYRAFRTQGFDYTVPIAGGTALTMHDSIVTLVRDDLGEVRFAGRPYAVCRSVTIGGRQVQAVRCWSAVDLAGGAGPLRVVNTHLEFDRPAQVEQARELLSILDGHRGPSLLAGDFNIDALQTGAAEVNLHAELESRGFADAWRLRGIGPGPTATQPEDLVNLDSRLDTRIDWVLSHGTGPCSRVGLLGASSDERAALGLWPSDHAGVAATLAGHRRSE